MHPPADHVHVYKGEDSMTELLAPPALRYSARGVSNSSCCAGPAHLSVTRSSEKAWGMTESAFPYSVLIPIGPGAEEPERAHDLLGALRRHQGGDQPKVVLIDDSPRPRDLGRLWKGATVLRTVLWSRRTPDPLTAMTVGTIEAMKLAEGAFAIKLDTDALIIAPFETALTSIFARDPSLGIVGAFDRSPNGGVRDWSRWPRMIRRTVMPLRLTPYPYRSVRLVSRADRRAARDVIAAAQRNPHYRMGAHCLGGAYAVSAALLQRAPEWKPDPWMQAGLGEDVVMGLMCGAAGLRMQNLVDRGETFGVTLRDLPAPPAELVDRGYSVIHSIKTGTYGTEEELRAWFRLRLRESA
jgi:hypothetical protein